MPGFLIITALFPALAQANDMTAIQYIFTAFLPALFSGISALLVMSLTLYLHKREEHNFLRGVCGFFTYASYAVTVLSFFMTMGVNADPLKNDMWKTLAWCFAAMAISCVFLFVAARQLKEPSAKGLLGVKLSLASYFILLFLGFIGTYAAGKLLG